MDKMRKGCLSDKYKTNINADDFQHKTHPFYFPHVLFTRIGGYHILPHNLDQTLDRSGTLCTRMNTHSYGVIHGNSVTKFIVQDFTTKHIISLGNDLLFLYL